METNTPTIELKEDGSEPIEPHRQELFVHEILKGRKAGNAYKLAGFDVTNDNSAAAAGARLLKSVKVQKRMTFLRRRAAEAVCVSKAEVIKKLWLNGLQCLGELPVTISKIKTKVKDKESGEVEYKIKNIEVFQRDPSAANKAFELVGQEFGMFNKKVEGGGKAGDFSDVQDDKLGMMILDMLGRVKTYAAQTKALPLPAPVPVESDTLEPDL